MRVFGHGSARQREGALGSARLGSGSVGAWEAAGAWEATGAWETAGAGEAAEQGQWEGGW